MSSVRIDKSLTVNEFVASSDIIPRSAYYQIENAQSSSDSNVAFYVTSPGRGMLLDPEVFVEYTLRIRAPADAANAIRDSLGSAVRGVPLVDANRKFALRQNYPVMRALENASVTINGQTLTERPSETVDAFNRIFLSQEESRTVATISSGYYDTGSFNWLTENPSSIQATADNTGNAAAAATLSHSVKGYNGHNDGGAAPVAINSLVNQYVDDEEYMNKGWTKRFMKIARKSRQSSDISDFPVAASHNSDILIQVFEPVPIAPFYMYGSRDSKRSIPHVDTITLNYTFSSRFSELMFQASTGENWRCSLVGDPAAPNPVPKLHLRWYQPPPQHQLPREITIPIWRTQHFQNRIAAPNRGAVAVANSDLSQMLQFGLGAEGSHTFNNIRLEQFPSLLFIYFKKDRNQSRFTDPSDHNLSIRSLQIAVDGMNGLILDATAAQLYKLWVENSMHRGMEHVQFDTWYQKCCCVVLKPADLGLLAGPGIDHPVTVNVTARYQNYNFAPRTGSKVIDSDATGRRQIYDDPVTGAAAAGNFGAIGAQVTSPYDMHVVAYYDKYKLMLTEDGRSQLSLLKLPSAGSAAPIASSTAAFNQVNL